MKSLSEPVALPCTLWVPCCTRAEPVAQTVLVIFTPSGEYVKIGTRWSGHLLKRSIFIERIYVIN